MAGQFEKATRHVHERLPLSCRLHKLQQKHAQRQKLAQRAQAAAEDEIAWDDDTPGASPAASPQQPAKAERTPADKVRHTEEPVAWLSGLAHYYVYRNLSQCRLLRGSPFMADQPAC